MIEILLELMMAIITIFAAGLLVFFQKKQHKLTKELNDEVSNSLKEITTKVTALTNEPTTESSLSYLELRMDSLNKCLCMIPVHKSPRDRRNNYAKSKKHFTDD